MTPTLYLSNWASLRTVGHFGPGPRLTIMARPRAWERGEGVVLSLLPARNDLDAVRAGDIGWEEYRRRYLARVPRARLAPGLLEHYDGERPAEVVVSDSTLCCSCAVGRPCHRQIAAELLREAGWGVVLDGAPFAERRSSP